MPLCYATSLDQRLTELIVLTVSRQWTAQVEWRIHQPIALEAGLGANIVDDEEAEIVHDVAMEVQRDSRVADQTHDRAHMLLGETKLVDLVVVLGYYTSVAMVLNVFDVPAPDTDEITSPMKA